MQHLLEVPFVQLWAQKISGPTVFMNRFQDGIFTCCPSFCGTFALAPCDDDYIIWRSIFSSVKLGLTSGPPTGLDCLFVWKNLTILCDHGTDFWGWICIEYQILLPICAQLSTLLTFSTNQPSNLEVIGMTLTIMWKIMDDTSTIKHVSNGGQFSHFCFARNNCHKDYHTIERKFSRDIQNSNDSLSMSFA